MEIEPTNNEPPPKARILLKDEEPLCIYPALAFAIGLNESIVIHRIYQIINRYDTLGEWLVLSPNEWGLEFPFWSESTIDRTLQSLCEKELLLCRRLTPKEILAIIKTKRTQVFTNNYIDTIHCSWCNAETYILHKHHFPIPQREGGKETVEICPNCHTEFHYLETINLYTIEKKFYNDLDKLEATND